MQNIEKARVSTDCKEISLCDPSFNAFCHSLRSDEQRFSLLEHNFKTFFAQLTHVLRNKLARLTRQYPQLQDNIDHKHTGEEIVGSNGTDYSGLDLNVTIVLNSDDGSAVVWDHNSRKAFWSSEEEIHPAIVKRLSDCCWEAIESTARANQDSVRILHKSKHKILATIQSLEDEEIKFDIIFALLEETGGYLLLPRFEQPDAWFEERFDKLFAHQLWDLDMSKRGLIHMIKALKLVRSADGPKSDSDKPILRPSAFEMAAFSVALTKDPHFNWNKSTFFNKFKSCLELIKNRIEHNESLPIPNDPRTCALARVRKTPANRSSAIQWLDNLLAIKSEQDLLTHLKRCAKIVLKRSFGSSLDGSGMLPSYVNHVNWRISDFTEYF